MISGQKIMAVQKNSKPLKLDKKLILNQWILELFLKVRVLKSLPKDLTPIMSVFFILDKREVYWLMIKHLNGQNEMFSGG
jgi:hypothetical protein